MKYSSVIDKQIAFLLQQMEKAMPEVRRQVQVYEKSISAGKAIKSHPLAHQFKNG